MSINVTLLFSREQYLAAADAYLKGIERRIAAGLQTNVGSVASVFISRWDVAANKRCPTVCATSWASPSPAHLQGVSRSARLRLAGRRSSQAGYNPQRLLLASTGTKDPKASDILYIKALAAPDTVNTMPEKTLLAFADHGEIGAVMPADGGNCEQVLASSSPRRVSTSTRWQRSSRLKGRKSFVKSWNDLLGVIASKSAVLK